MKHPYAHSHERSLTRMRAERWYALSISRCVSVLLLSAMGCRTHPVAIEYYDNDDAMFSRASFARPCRDAIQTIADQTFVAVRTRLPMLPRQLTLQVAVSKAVIPETGENGYASPPERIVWSLAVAGLHFVRARTSQIARSEPQAVPRMSLFLFRRERC
jgi:hypothetical protein